MKKRKKKRMGIIPAIFLILLVGSVGLLGYLIWQEVQNEITIKDMEKDAITFTQEPETEENPSKDYSFDWDGLLAINSDVVGWLRFDEPSRINYPIVQGDSNQTYLKHDWQGNYLNAGAIFLNKTNRPDFTDMNSVIYGHRMINGSMFGSLKKYSAQNFMDTYPYFYIYTPDGKKRTYEIFVYAQVTDGSGTYTQMFETAEERMGYYQDVLSHAITKRNVDLDEFDTTVTLSTCASRGYYDRMVLIGKLISIEVDKQP